MVQPAQNNTSFNFDPLAYIDEMKRQDQSAFWLSDREYCVTDPQLCKSVLANDRQLFAEHSDFFRHRNGYLKPRAIQQLISRDGAAFLSQHIKSLSSTLDQKVSTHINATLTKGSTRLTFPDDANLLIARLLRPALLADGSASAVHRQIDKVIHRVILRGRGHKPQPPTGFWFRFMMIHQMSKEVERRRESYQLDPNKKAGDILDVIAKHCHLESSENSQFSSDNLVQTYLSFLVATIGSIGYLLAWTLYLIGQHKDTQDIHSVNPRYIVLESLRLWPVAWLMSRKVKQGCQLNGVDLPQNIDVIVCPYHTHRDERYWQAAEAFAPQRWEKTDDNKAYIPFGWGEHRCTASGISITLVSDLLQIFLSQYDLSFHFEGDKPCVGVALSPPYYELELNAH